MLFFFTVYTLPRTLSLHPPPPPPRPLSFAGRDGMNAYTYKTLIYTLVQRSRVSHPHVSGIYSQARKQQQQQLEWSLTMEVSAALCRAGKPKLYQGGPSPLQRLPEILCVLPRVPQGRSGGWSMGRSRSTSLLRRNGGGRGKSSRGKGELRPICSVDHDRQRDGAGNQTEYFPTAFSQARGWYHGGRRPSSDDSFHSPTVIPPSALNKPSIMKRYNRRRTTGSGQVCLAAPPPPPPLSLSLSLSPLSPSLSLPLPPPSLPFAKKGNARGSVFYKQGN